jgi:hypothetical protein
MARNLLHRSDLNEFTDWLCENGWSRDTHNPPWEVGRFRHIDGGQPIIIYTRKSHDSSRMSVHLTLHGRAEECYWDWRRARGR